MESLGQLALLVGLLSAWLLYKWKQEDKNDETHKCSFCGGQVKRDASRILSYTDSQAKEVALGAVTYEVGSCSGCRRTQNIRHPALRKGDIHKCDYCHCYAAKESVSYTVDDKAQVRLVVYRYRAGR